MAGIPLIELPVAAGVPRPGPWMAVVYSGDGGWRDLDKTLAEDLARHGVPVVGVDSLRYLWREKTPDRVAADLARILRHYGERWDARRAAMIGYSSARTPCPSP